jgi:hypothetical protein
MKSLVQLIGTIKRDNDREEKTPPPLPPPQQNKHELKRQKYGGILKSFIEHIFFSLNRLQEM